MKELNIGEMAQLNCVSAKTLRIYHEMGLLVPRRIDPQTGYRFYDATQCFAIDQIQQLQAMGATLAEIRDAVASEDDEALVELVRAHRAALDDEIGRLRLARHSADEFMNNYERYVSSLPIDAVVFEYLPERYVIEFDLEHEPAMPINNGSGPDLESWEVALHLAKRRLIERNIPVELFYNVGWRMNCEDFCSGNYRISGIIVTIDTQGLARQYAAQNIPAGEWATYLVKGYLGEGGANSEYAALQHLSDTISEKGLEACGDCLSEVVFNTPTLFDGWRDALFKLQIPVRTK